MLVITREDSQLIHSINQPEQANKTSICLNILSQRGPPGKKWVGRTEMYEDKEAVKSRNEREVVKQEETVLKT